MARPNQDAIETFVSITGASEAIALQKLEEHGGDLNEAVNAYFSEGDRNNAQPRPVTATQDDFMAIDDPMEVESQRPSLPVLSATRNLNPFAILDSTFGRSLLDGRGATEFSSHVPFVSHPREVREIPIEVKDGNGQSGGSGSGPVIEEVTGTAQVHGPEIHGTVIIDDEEEDVPIAPSGHPGVQSERSDGLPVGNHNGRNPRPSAPVLDGFPDYNNDIEEAMIQAAIEASKRDVEESYRNQQFGALNDSSNPGLQHWQSHLGNAELEREVSSFLEAQKKSLHEGAAEPGVFNPSDVGDLGKLTADKERQGVGSFKKESLIQPKLEVGSSSIHDEAEDIEEQPLVRHRSRRISSGSVDSAKDAGENAASAPSSPRQDDVHIHSQQNGDPFPSDEWGGISSEEHDEAVMLEAAIFGGIPEGTAYNFGYSSQQTMQSGLERNVGRDPWQAPRPPSPTLAAQRLLREQQDDEYLASLQADKEKELKAIEEAEARRLEELAAKEAALEEERRKLREEEEFERQLAAKEASLPEEPALDDENAMTLLVRMPDGSRRGRRFLKTDKLQSLFDFIDVGRGVKPGTYRLVMPYPRRAFGDHECGLTLTELGLTSKQEALFLELI